MGARKIDDTQVVVGITGELETFWDSGLELRDYLEVQAITGE